MDSTNHSITGKADLSRGAIAPRSAAKPSNHFFGPSKAAVAALAAALLLGATACGPSGAGSPAAGQGTASAPSATVTATETAAATAGQTSSSAAATTPAAPAPEKWQTYKSTDGKVSFDYPAGWTAKDVPAGTPDFPASGIQVADETGKKAASFYYGAGGGLGGACGPEKYKATELDAAPTSLTEQWAVDAGVRFSYRVLDQTSIGKGFSYQVGLVDKTSGQLTDSCLMYSVVSGAPKRSLSFADRASKGPEEPVFKNLAEAKAYMGTAEYQKLKKMIVSLRITA